MDSPYFGRAHAGRQGGYQPPPVSLQARIFATSGNRPDRWTQEMGTLFSDTFLFQHLSLGDFDNSRP
jgi:hypothetical protein